MALVLQIKTEWSSYTLELKPGESVVLGRSPEANIQIPRPSVSQQHLRITWDGEELLFQDLSSSNGTYRMPQDSPFVEARFPARSQSLNLKISKSLVDFSWQLREVTSTMAIDPTRTEVAPQGSSPSDHAADETEVLKVPSDSPKSGRGVDQSQQVTQHLANPLADSLAELGAKTPANSAGAASPQVRARKDLTPVDKKFEPGVVTGKINHLLTTPVVEPPYEPGLETKISQVLNKRREISLAEATESSAWVLLAGFTFAAFLVSFFGGRLILQGIVTAHGAQLRNGGMLDVLIIWGGFIINRPGYFAGVVLVAFVAFVLLLRRFRSGKSAFADRLARKLQLTGWAPIWPPRTLGFLFFALFFVWPVAWAAIYKTPPQKTLDAWHFWQVVNKRAATPAERVQQLRTLLPKLQGSSLLYKEMYGIQRQRILDECKGVGMEAAWDAKKVCLVLLTAVAIEALEEVQPGLLGDVAARAAILLSLDGISRVIAVEGLEAPTIPFFLNSLDAVGLGPEREDIQNLITRQGATQEEVLNSLLDLRKRIELRLEARQIEMKLPRIFVMSFPSPIESGI